MEPKEETDLSKVTQCLIHTECSVALIGSQRLRKLNKDQQPQVESLRWQTPWWTSQQYMSVSRVFLGYQSLSNPHLHTCSYLKYELITELLDKNTSWPTWKHHNYAYEEKGLWRYKFQSEKSSRLYSLQIAITSLGISQDYSWVP